MEEPFEFPKQGIKHRGKSEEDLVKVIKLDYLIGIATLVEDFAENIAFLIKQRQSLDPIIAKRAADELLGLLFPAAKDPKQLKLPSLDIDALIDAMDESG